MAVPRFQPESVADLSDLVGNCAASGRPLHVLGRGTKASWGHPVAAQAELSLGALSGILCYEPAELVMTARAGTTVNEIEAALTESHQQLAFEPCPGTPGCYDTAHPASIGGVFACNLSGPRRYVAGAARDHLLGFTAVSGRGDTFRSGGTVVKNVTGYDFCKLLCGSFGTLAVMTEVSFRTVPRAPCRLTLALTGLDDHAALLLMADLAASAWQLTGLCWLASSGRRGLLLPELHRHPGSGILLVRLEGMPRGTLDRATRLRHALDRHEPTLILDHEQSDALWRGVRDLDMLKPSASDDALLRLSIPISAAPLVADALAGIADCHWMADHGGGTFWLRVHGELLLRASARLRALLQDTGGVLTAIEGSSQVPAFGPVNTANAVLNGRIKASLDPADIFNPGKLGSAINNADTIQP